MLAQNGLKHVLRQFCELESEMGLTQVGQLVFDGLNLWLWACQG